jgi:stage III sporulation protein SpoIIIAA
MDLSLSTLAAALPEPAPSGEETPTGAAAPPEPQRVLRSWEVPEDVPRLADSFNDELLCMFKELPEALTTYLQETFRQRLVDLVELYLQLGHAPEAIFQDRSGTVERVPLGGVCGREEIGSFAAMFDPAQQAGEAVINMGSKRRGIAETLHRISLITHFDGDVIGVTIRVGRSYRGTLQQMVGPNALLIDTRILLGLA